MQTYALTPTGRKATKSGAEDTEELKVLQFIRENGTATDNELDTVGDRLTIRLLKKHGLIKELGGK